MTMNASNKLAGHMKRASLIIAIATRRTETALAAERNKFQISAMRTTIHGTAIRRVTTTKHLVNVFNDCLTRMQGINHFFIIITKNILKYTAHVIIIEEWKDKNNPTPQRLRGRGAESVEDTFLCPLAMNREIRYNG